MVITAIMAFRQRGIVQAFERAAATTAAMAQRPEQLDVKQGLAWQQLVSQAVLRCPGEGRYFLDVANWQRLRRRRHRLALASLVGVLILLALMLVLRSG